jgi:hypothetical protein
MNLHLQPLRLTRVLTWLVLATLLGQGADAASRVNYANGIELDQLITSAQTYLDVVVYSRNQDTVYFEHAKGLGNVKIAQLDPASQRRLGLVVEEPTEQGGSTSWATWHPSFWLQHARNLSPLGVTSLVFLVILAVGLYLYCSFLFWLICVKAGAEPGITVWLPVVQIIPLLRAAGMSVLWPLFMLMVLVSSYFLRAHLANHIWLVASFAGACVLVCLVTWSVKICLARKKHPALAALLVIPGMNFFALLYLAGSK